MMFMYLTVKQLVAQDEDFIATNWAFLSFIINFFLKRDSIFDFFVLLLLRK